MPRQRSRSPLSPILATESATVRLFFILSVLLCSVNKAGLKTETWLLYCLRLRSRSPHNAKHSTSYIINYYLYPDIYPCRTSCPILYYACAALRANVAGRIGNRVSPAESSVSACIGSASGQRATVRCILLVVLQTE